MCDFPPPNYAAWRARARIAFALQEPHDETPNERLLQIIWQHQRLRRDELVDTEGRPVQVLHPGFWNREAGPDFRAAIVQVGHGPPQSGDIEIDVHPQAWQTHGHHRNPNYGQVILHVVWDAPEAWRAPISTLALRPHLDAPIDELRSLQGLDAAAQEFLLGRCAPPLEGLPEPALTRLLLQAARIRLEQKGQAIAARARQTGWQQALWETLFAGLGYKRNVWPLRRLAELLPVLCPPGARLEPFRILTRLLGVAGLLPVELPRRRSRTDDYIRQLWDCWWRQKSEFAEIQLPRRLWCGHGLRPANHPERRLALAAQWLSAGDVPARLEQWLLEDLPDPRLVPSLHDRLQGSQDPYWSWHWTLRSPRLSQPQPLLGPQRLTDLAINAVLPWLWMRACVGRNQVLRQIAESRYFAWPAAEDNAVLRLARQRLLGGTRKPLFRKAALQQGLLQVVHDFCEHTNALCDDCGFPGLARAADDPRQLGLNW